MLFVILLVLTIRICMLPRISEGLNFYLNPDFSALKSQKLWMLAGGMALFAIGMGPGYLLVYGSYLKPKDDVNLATSRLPPGICWDALWPVL